MNPRQKMLNMVNWRARLAALVLTGAMPLLALADNAIRSVTSTQQAGAEVVRIEFDEALGAPPTGFAVQVPPRVALDLPGVSNGLGKTVVDINQGNLRSVAVAQSGERSRLVLNLRQPSNYRVELQGKALVVVLEAAGAPAMAPSAGVAATTGDAVHFATPQNEAPAAVT